MTAGFSPIGPLIERCSRLDSLNLIIAAKLTLLVISTVLICTFRSIDICYYGRSLQVGDFLTGIGRLICSIRSSAGRSCLAEC